MSRAQSNWLAMNCAIISTRHFASPIRRLMLQRHSPMLFWPVSLHLWTHAKETKVFTTSFLRMGSTVTPKGAPVRHPVPLLLTLRSQVVLPAASQAPAQVMNRAPVPALLPAPARAVFQVEARAMCPALSPSTSHAFQNLLLPLKCLDNLLRSMVVLHLRKRL